jgi:tRNA U34 5-carboxymethylaminomethyl modifying GTPase MnmE/TrmE
VSWSFLWRAVLNHPDKKLILLFNKVDAAQPEILAACQNNWQDGIYISAKQKYISPLTNALTEFVTIGLLSKTKNVVSKSAKNCITVGTITGEISTDDLLENIFSKFCLGK